MNPTSANATCQEDIDRQGERWYGDDGKGIGDGLVRGGKPDINISHTLLWSWMEEKTDSTTRRKSTQLTINSINGSFQFFSAARATCANNVGACTLYAAAQWNLFSDQNGLQISDMVRWCDV